MKIGILGGTFDPVHFGHLRVAEEVGEAQGLEKVYLIPAAQPPHKDKKPVSDFHHRLAMIRIATKGSPLLEAMDLEGRRQGLSYSIETLRELQHYFGPQPELFFIIGTDAFLEIKTWKEYSRLFDYSHFVVIERPGFHSDELESFIYTLGAAFKKQGQQGHYVASSGKELFSKRATLLDISATRIREMVAAGRSIRYLVPYAVGVYIREKGLYKP
ncbi:nicotinate-nucleotide adenylyltransferase [Thermodesulfobacteriota bacterium]